MNHSRAPASRRAGIFILKSHLAFQPSEFFERALIGFTDQQKIDLVNFLNTL
jgi:hypothetical protein